ncbi:MAG: flagella basal body P-ring formation protein FlgA [Balneola sp.]|nr:flagella basal body P-ring formation protein FlgA [Balneola sp.]
MCFQLFIVFFAMVLNPAEMMSLANAEDVILQKAASAIEQNYGDEDMRVTLSTRWMPGSLRELSSDNITSVQLVGALKKYTRFQVSYLDAGWPEKAEVQLQVEMEVNIPTLTQRKQRGEKLQESDLTKSWVAIDLNQDQPIKNKEELIGKTLRNSLNAGEFIQPGQIGNSFMVNAGEVVQMIFQQDALQIVLSCESRQDGAEGEKIQVYCKETRKKYLTKIINTGEVQWLRTD